MQTDLYNEGFQLEFHDETNPSTMAISTSYQTKVVAYLVAKWLHQQQEVTRDEPNAA